MPAQLVNVTLWTDLTAAGGTPQGACWPWTKLTTTYRSDGDDRVSGVIARTATGATDLVRGSVLRYERADGTYEHWIVSTLAETFGADTIAVTALPARSWLAERVLVHDGSDFGLSGSDTLSNVLDALIATDDWPSWVIAGTIDTDPTISYDWTNTNGLAALLAMVEAANATEDVALANVAVRMVFRRVSSSQYAVDFLTDPVTGTPYLTTGKNVEAFAIRQDRTQQVDAIIPRNASGAGIGEAMFAVRSTSGGTTMDMRDWAYRPDFLGIAYDGQWVGWYAVAPDGTTSIITDSVASTQQLVVADNSAWGSGNNATVRISPVVGGTPTIRVARTEIANPKTVLRSGTWSAKINWLPNSRWDEWTSATVVKDWTTTGGLTTNRLSSAGNFETGTYGLECVTSGSAGALTVSEVLMPDEVVTNGGGTQTWRVGVRFKMTANTGASIAFQRSVNGGSSWTSMGSGLIVNPVNTWQTYETTFTTTSAILPNRPRLRFSSTAVSGSKAVIDRVWLFRDGVDDGDDTYIGNGPSVGFYEAQRALLQSYESGGTTYELGVADRYRDDPTGFPLDNLLVGQEARVVIPERSVDVTLPVAQLDVNELAPLQTAVQLGAQRRRLTSLV